MKKPLTLSEISKLIAGCDDYVFLGDNLTCSNNFVNTMRTQYTVGGLKIELIENSPAYKYFPTGLFHERDNAHLHLLFGDYFGDVLPVCSVSIDHDEKTVTFVS